LAYTTYPSIQLAIQDTPYNEFISNEDLAQYETNVGIAMPMNLKMKAQATVDMMKEAIKPGPREKFLGFK
jgi:hypothetical protein